LSTSIGLVTHRGDQHLQRDQNKMQPVHSTTTSVQHWCDATSFPTSGCSTRTLPTTAH
jgi:hypothetical protein